MVITTRKINGKHNDQSWYLEPAGEKRICISMAYTDSGRQPAAVTDALGNTVRYAYGAGEHLLTKVTDPAGTETAYTYDSVSSELTGVSCAGAGVTYTYDYGKIKTIGHNWFNYSFDYDEFGNTASVKAGKYTLVTNEYLPHDGMVSKSA